MTTIHVTKRDGSSSTVASGIGGSLMAALKRSGISEIAAICGGCASCGTCHVYVGDGWTDRLPAMTAEEDELLGFSDWRQANSRLSCQITVSDDLDGLAVTIAPED